MKEQITVKTALLREFRALKIWNRYSKGMVAKAVVTKVFSKVSMYLPIVLTARFINMLAMKEPAANVVRMVIITLCTTAGLAIVSSLLERILEKDRGDRFWFLAQKVLADKKADMDFVDADSQKVADLEAQILQNMNWSSWGLFRAAYCFDGLLDAVLSIICGLGLSVSMFVLPVTKGGFMILNHPLIAVLMVVLMIVNALLSGYFLNFREKAWADYSDEARLGNRIFSAYGWFSQDLSRAMDVRLYRQDRITTQYMLNGDIFTERSTLATKFKGKIGILSSFSVAFQSIMAGAIYFFVCAKAWAGAFPIGSATQYITAVTGVFYGISGLISQIEELKSNGVFLEDTYEFLDYPNNMYQGSLTTEKRRDNKYEIEFRNVSFKYPGSNSYALKNVNLKFNIGEKLAIVGMNGSGKTTFIKLLCRLYDPTEGTILLNGIDIRKFRYDEYMNIFSIVFQDFKLFAMPLGENVATSSDYDKEKVLSVLEKAGFGERLEKMSKGLDTHLYKQLDKEGVEISGGEAQKIAIARALYKDAAFIILDEPTAALDPVAEAEIYEKFSEMVDDRTAVYISHRLSSCKFCDEIAVFDEGKVVQKGTHADLLQDTSGKYYELWNAQAQYYNDEKAVS